MIRSLFAAVAATAIFASSASAETDAISCAGPVKAYSTPASLMKELGKGVAATAQVDGSEGETMEAVVIRASDPARRIEVVWSADDQKSGAQAIVRGDSRVSVAGLSLGQDLAAAEAANGKAFSLSGFGWDMGGNVTDWKGGRLAKLAGGCFLSVQFGYAEDAPEKAIDRVSGDRTFSSADTAMRAVRPVIQSLTLGWPAKE
ncbi:hypothetical protein [Chenggangzhangella methanolivorans]|uniref:Uncharacterized protein n=1 Tax=Chenggangzhangella methanolivorans TaxID=1437009 RepID=A0A9E6R8C5_9HYPH|nr:hypothetical protein [Chenggangzhangella methanolivorans]QZN99351.1 hypothetical protein K6K41_21635 [Chenggangzhangella methanolivorans]